MKQWWGKIEVTNSEDVNPFVAIVFAEEATQYVGVGKSCVKSVDIWKDSTIRSLCADITTVDVDGIEHKHRYIGAVGSCLR